MKRIVLSLAIIAALSAPILNAQEKLKILSTIKPVHSLVAAIAGGFGESELIIPGHASPHHYSLKPSDLRRLNAADLIFRIDSKLESFLQKSLRSISKEKVITLAHAAGLELLPAVESDDHAVQSQEKSHSHETEEMLPSVDYHLWLAPGNAVILANYIRDALIKAIPEQRTKLIANAKQLVISIREKDQTIIEQLESVKDTPFLVTHNAWQYFTTHYQLNQIGSVSAQEHLRPSAKAISEARADLVNSNIKCLVAEPNLKKKTLRVLTEDLPINITEIDPLGQAIPESNLAYPQLLQYTADKLLNCLKNK